MDKVGQLGTITVTCHRVKVSQAPPEPTSKKAKKKLARRYAFQNMKPAIKDDKVAEKNLKGKAVSHQAKYVDRRYHETIRVAHHFAD